MEHGGRTSLVGVGYMKIITDREAEVEELRREMDVLSAALGKRRTCKKCGGLGVYMAYSPMTYCTDTEAEMVDAQRMAERPCPDCCVNAEAALSAHDAPLIARAENAEREKVGYAIALKRANGYIAEALKALIAMNMNRAADLLSNYRTSSQAVDIQPEAVIASHDALIREKAAHTQYRGLVEVLRIISHHPEKLAQAEGEFGDALREYTAKVRAGVEEELRSRVAMLEGAAERSRESGCWCDESGHPCRGCEWRQEKDAMAAALNPFLTAALEFGRLVAGGISLIPDSEVAKRCSNLWYKRILPMLHEHTPGWNLGTPKIDPNAILTAHDASIRKPLEEEIARLRALCGEAAEQVKYIVSMCGECSGVIDWVLRQKGTTMSEMLERLQDAEKGN